MAPTVAGVVTDGTGNTASWSASWTTGAAAQFSKVIFITKEGVPTQAQINTFRANVPAARGYSSRQTWLNTVANPNVWAQTLTLGRNAGCNRLAARLIPGRKMPASLMGRTLTADDGSGVFPAPCNAGKTPNAVFIANLKTEMRKAAQALIAQAALVGDLFPILHWPWFAKEWSEWYYGPEVQGDCTRAQMEAAHRAIVVAAKELADEFPTGAFVTGFQMSGHGPIQPSAPAMAQFIADTFGDDRVIVHANGLSSGGQWGAQPPGGPADQAMDPVFDIAATDNMLVGLQAIQPWGTAGNAQQTPAQWAGIYDQIRLASGASWEPYLESGLSDYGVSGALAAFQAESAAWLTEPPT